MTPPSVSPARAVAFDLLLRVRQTKAFASELLHSDVTATLSSADHGLATELVMGTLRWRSLLDSYLAEFLSQPLARMDAEVLTAMEMGAYQLLFLDRIPAHAAIHESVELVKLARKRSATGMANAVLRKVAAKRAASETAPAQAVVEVARWFAAISSAPDAVSLAHASAHPLWIVERWVEAFGIDAVRQICAQDQRTPITSFFLNHSAAIAKQSQEIDAALSIDGITWDSGALLRDARRLRSGDLTGSAAFRNRSISIQDEGSHLVALLLGKGSRILDCCAAPGGKTRVLAAHNPQAEIIACEIHPRRAQLLRDLVPAGNVQVIEADATRLSLTGQFDRILVDAPCSGTGTLSRNPEIKWNLTPQDLADLHRKQVEILRSALRFLAPNGTLLYSTCSLEAEENQSVVEEVLAESNNSATSLHLRDIAQELNHLRESGELAWQDATSLTDGPYLSTRPGVHPCDGFFAALIVRK